MAEVWIFMGLQLAVLVCGLLMLRFTVKAMRESNASMRQALDWFDRLNTLFGVELGEGCEQGDAEQYVADALSRRPGGAERSE